MAARRVSDDARLPEPSATDSPMWDRTYRFPRARPRLAGLTNEEYYARFPWTHRLSEEFRALIRQTPASGIAAMRKQLRKEIAFYRDFIERLEMASKAGETNSEDYTEARHDALVRLSVTYEGVHEYELARDTLEQALSFAYVSDDRECIRQSLEHLGMFEYGQAAFLANGGSDPEGLDRAAIYLQRSLAFLDGTVPWRLVQTLEWLCRVWDRREETLALAIGMADWIIVLAPSEFSSFENRYSILMQWHRKEVRAVARRKTFANSVEVVHCCAANYKLGKRERAHELAQLGLEMAQQEANPHLVNLFQNFLAHASGGQIAYEY